jgi:hypothetical protein
MRPCSVSDRSARILSHLDARQAQAALRHRADNLENPLPLARKYLARAAQDGRRLLAARNAVLWPNLERLPLG